MKTHNIDSKPPLPMLITGVAGVSGYNAFHYFRSLYGDQVIGIRQASMWPLRGDGIVACDVEDQPAIERLWNEYQFASLLNAAGSCRLKSCELDPEMAHRANVLGTMNLMREASRHDATVIHLSIDLVFSGDLPWSTTGAPGRTVGYVETDTPDPVTVYGAKMLEAETLVANTCRNACILRISLPMGTSFNGHAGAVDWIASRFKQHKPATLYFDEVRTPQYTDCLNRLFATLLRKPLSGLYHASGPRRLSLYEIAQVVSVTGGYDPALLQGCPRIDAGPMPPRAGDVSLNSSKLANALGYSPFDPWPFDDHLVPTGQDWHREPHRLSGSPENIVELLYQNPNPVHRVDGNEGKRGVPPSRNELWGENRFSK